MKRLRAGGVLFAMYPRLKSWEYIVGMIRGNNSVDEKRQKTTLPYPFQFSRSRSQPAMRLYKM
jgi:hypothetical protein